MKLQRIAQQARGYPEMVFNNVFHLIDWEFLLELTFRTLLRSLEAILVEPAEKTGGQAIHRLFLCSITLYFRVTFLFITTSCKL
jgi:hypothetical protein